MDVTCKEATVLLLVWDFINKQGRKTTMNCMLVRVGDIVWTHVYLNTDTNVYIEKYL